MGAGLGEVANVDCVSLLGEGGKAGTLLLSSGSDGLDVGVVLGNGEVCVGEGDPRLGGVVCGPSELSGVTGVDDVLHLCLGVVLDSRGEVVEGEPSGCGIGLPVVGAEGESCFSGGAIEDSPELITIVEHAAQSVGVIQREGKGVVEGVDQYSE